MRAFFRGVYIVAMTLLMLALTCVNSMLAFLLFGHTWPFHALGVAHALLVGVFASQWRKWLRDRNDYYR